MRIEDLTPELAQELDKQLSEQLIREERNYTDLELVVSSALWRYSSPLNLDEDLALHKQVITHSRASYQRRTDPIEKQAIQKQIEYFEEYIKRLEERREVLIQWLAER